MSERARELTLLIVGDLIVFIIALFFTLVVRYVSWPSFELLQIHLGPFFLMSLLWVVGFYVSGLYDKQITPVKAGFVARLFGAQITNVVIAGILFLLFPFGITPKTNLAIYLLVSILLLTLWRWRLFPLLGPRGDMRALLLAEGDEALELAEEVNGNTRYPYYIHSFIKPSELAQKTDANDKLLQLITKERITLCIVDARRPEMVQQLSSLLSAMMKDRQFSMRNFTSVYEETFDKVPLSTIDDAWCISMASRHRSVVFVVVKRITDIFSGILLLLALLLCLPFVWLAMRLGKDKGPLFIAQERVGKYGQPILVYKIRTMTQNRSASADWLAADAAAGNVVTPVGAVLRKLSVDEFPQGWAMVKGDLSIIGPRSEISGISSRLEEDISHYAVRFLVTPGLSGWAQTNQRYKGGNISPQSLSETKEKFAYDLYYIKHQSLLLDFTIILKTIKTLFARMGTLLRL